MNIIRWLYGLPDASLERPWNLVVPLEYGALPENKILPDATEQGLLMTARFIKEGKAEAVVWGNTDYFGPGATVIHDEKLKLLSSQGVQISLLKTGVITSNNSIQEARAIAERCPGADRVLLICDWSHARRARLIWKHFFPQAEIGIVSVAARWNENHPSVWQRSLCCWMIGNILHHLAIRLLGIESCSKIVHSVEP